MQTMLRIAVLALLAVLLAPYASAQPFQYNATPRVFNDGDIGGASVDVNGNLRVAKGLVIKEASFTRPADVTAYAVGDAVNNSTSAPVALQFTTAVRTATGQGEVVSGRISKNTATVTNATFRVWLYAETITPANDNAAMNNTYADRLKRLGFLECATMVAVGSATAEAACTPNNIAGSVLPIVLNTGTTLYGAVEARAAYTPGSADQFAVTLGIRQN